MIVRDEERFLARCLKSLKGLADEIVVVDTGSTDRTPQIARQFGALVFPYSWDGNFGKARNYSLDRATGDWILVMDSDEVLHPGDGAALRALLSHPTAEGFILKVTNYYGPTAGDEFAIDPVCRLFRNRPEYRYEDRIHEEIGHVILKYQSPDRLLPSDVRILHYGYLDEVLKAKQKNRRNQLILEQVLRENPTNPALLYCYGTELYQDGKYDQALVHLQKAWRLCQGTEGYASDLCVKTALCYREMARLPEALYMLRTGISKYPDFPDLYFLQGQILQTMRELDQAAQAYQQAVAVGIAPAQYTAVNGAGTFRSRYALGKVYEAAYMYPQAIREYHRALVHNSHFNPALLGLLQVMPIIYTPREIQGYIQHYLRFDLADSTLTLCELLTSAGHVQLASIYLERLIPDALNDPARFWFLKGVVSFLLNQLDDALTAFSQLEQASRYWSLSLRYQLICFWSLAQWDRAEKTLTSLENACPDRAVLYRAVHEYYGPGYASPSQTATPQLARAVKTRTNDDKDPSKTATLVEALRLTSSAYVLELIDLLLTVNRRSPVLELLAMLEPATRSVRIGLAQVFEKHGNITEAENQINAILQQDGLDSSLYRMMAWWHIHRGNWQKGYRLLQAAIAAAPADVVNYLALAQFWTYRAIRYLRSIKRENDKVDNIVNATLGRLLPVPAPETVLPSPQKKE